MSRKSRLYSQAFKVTAVERMAKAANVAALSRELGVQRELLYLWQAKYRGQAKYRAEGAAGLRSRGRPSETIAAPAESAPEVRIAGLERKIGQQQVELDFFRAALQRVRELRPSSGEPGETASTQ